MSWNTIHNDPRSPLPEQYRLSTPAIPPPPPQLPTPPDGFTYKVVYHRYQWYYQLTKI